MAADPVNSEVVADEKMTPAGTGVKNVFTPSIKCTCGCSVSFGSIPSPTEWLFISEVDYDRFQARVAADELYRQMSTFLKCDHCGRLWVFWNGFANRPAEYVPA